MQWSTWHFLLLLCLTSCTRSYDDWVSYGVAPEMAKDFRLILEMKTKHPPGAIPARLRLINVADGPREVREDILWHTDLLSIRFFHREVALSHRLPGIPPTEMPAVKMVQLAPGEALTQDTPDLSWVLSKTPLDVGDYRVMVAVPAMGLESNVVAITIESYVRSNVPLGDIQVGIDGLCRVECPSGGHSGRDSFGAL